MFQISNIPAVWVLMISIGLNVRDCVGCGFAKTPFLDHLSPRKSSRARATLSVLLLVQDKHPGLNMLNVSG